MAERPNPEQNKERAIALASLLLMGAAALSATSPLFAQTHEEAFSPQRQGIFQVDLPDGDIESFLNAVIAQRLGMRRPYRVEAAGRLGHSAHDVRKEAFEDERRRVAVVVKNYSEKYESSRKDFQKDLQNELEMNAAFRAAGLKTLDFIVSVPNKGIIVTRFLENGVPGAEVVARARRNDSDSLGLIERLGADLAAAHRNNLCVRDLKPDNFMASQGEVVFIDLDRAGYCRGKALGAARAWDIAWFSYSAAALLGPGSEGGVISAFVKGYLENGGSPRVVRAAARIRPAYARLRSFSSISEHLPWERISKLGSALTRN